MPKFMKIIGCVLATTMIMGGSIMAGAVNENNSADNKIHYAHELDAQAYDGNDLGASYTKAATTFKVWAPTASRVAVKIYATGSPEEEGAQDISTTSMTKGDKGVWTAKIEGDKKNLYYTYLVTVNGVTRETADIYAKAAGVNGNRSMIVDLNSTNPEGWEKDKHILCDNPTDAVVWEVHIKDFSNSEVSGVSLKHRGKYLAFTESGTTLDGKGKYSTCIDYLKKLGITHVQLLPVYDYATVDESDTASDQFNWGYDPKNYNVPEGSYSTDPFHGEIRITEFKQMIKALHDAGIGVIMDVVYNHTFTAEGGWFEMTVPGYYYRMRDDGTFSDGSACGNETASEHLMYRKYMIDSVLYWTNEYHIDGFRFDLMGVHDVTSMNEIRKALDTRVRDGQKIIMYGEPWTGGSLASKEPTAVKSNIKLLDKRIGAFNDDFRDAVKGHVFNGRDQGFIQSGSNMGNLRAAIKGNTIENNWSAQPSQTVTYTSAHDNYTLYDKLVLSVKNDMSYDVRDEQLVDMNKLAAALTFTSQGINFMQAGEEFARTKLGDENSYISSAEINQLDWNNTAEYADLVSYYSGLIDIRKHYKPFRDASMTSAELINFVNTDAGVVAYTLENAVTKDKEWNNVAVIVNSNDKEVNVKLTAADGKTLPAEWTIIANKTEAGLNDLGTVEGNSVAVPPRSAMILADKASFEKLGIQSENCTVRVEYKNADTDEVILSKSFKGLSGSSYVAEKDKSLDTEYDFEHVEGNEEGKFTKDIQKVTYYYKKFKGEIIELTVNYLKEANGTLDEDEENAAPSITEKIREGSEYTAAVKNVDGMEMDISKFPANASGIAGKENITVNYYYKKLDDSDLVIHYYNSNEWEQVNAYVYRKNGDDKTEYTEADGDAMKPDSGLGDGWYTLTVKAIGGRDSLYAVFSDADGSKDSSFGSSGCKVQGEVWINGTDVKYSGKVNVIHTDSAGKVLKTEVLSGKTGEEYTTSEGDFDGLQLFAKTANTSGKYSEDPAYVIYSYEEIPHKEEKPTKTIALIIGGSALLAGAAAVSVALARKKKRL